jgi:hypothetical protein
MITFELSAIWVIVSAIVVILAIGGAFLKARKYIEDCVKGKLSSNEIIGKISLLVKPDMIFDEKGSIVADRGAASLIQDRGIHITMEKNTFDSIPTEIRISFSRHLKLPPLLTPLNPDMTFVWPERGESHDWIYKLSYSGTSHSEKEFVRRSL